MEFRILVNLSENWLNIIIGLLGQGSRQGHSILDAEGTVLQIGENNVLPKYFDI